MHDYLFRGKRVDNGEWVFGGYFKEQNCGHSHMDSCHFIMTDSMDSYEADPDTVGMFTGLTDKNGVKVFDGDIIKSHYANARKAEHIETVVFHGGAFIAESRFNGGGYSCAYLCDGIAHFACDKSIYMDSMEVIGNRWDNPELLEGGHP